MCLHSQLWAQHYVAGEVIVKLKSSAGAMGAQSVMGKANANSQIILQNAYDNMGVYHFKAKQQQQMSTEELIQTFQNDPSVEFVEPNYVVVKESMDPSQTGNAGAQKMSAQQVAAMSVSGANTLLASDTIFTVSTWPTLVGTNIPVVAIIDSGVELAHGALSNAIWQNPGEVGLDGNGNSKSTNGIDDDGNGYVDDWRGWDFYQNDNNPNDCDGHGTHVAGIVRGTGQELTTFPSPTPLIKIMAVRFLDCWGNGTTSNAIKGIYYAVNKGATILNNSWGGGGYSQALHEAIVYSYNANSLFVAAAGNSSNNNDSAPSYPAAYDVPNVVAVASTGATDTLSSFSNYGAHTVHLAAPGENITSSIPFNSYFPLSGTSMATPFVSGTAALMSHERPSMIAYQLRTLMLSHTDYAAGLLGKVATSGRLNTYNSVDEARTATLDNSRPDYVISLSSSNRGLASTLATSGAAGCGTVSKMRAMGGGGSFSFSWLQALWATVLILAPLLIAAHFRQQSPESRRRYERFKVESQVKLSVGGKELVGDMQTISAGGLGVNAQAMLDKGSLVTITIQSPDGKESVQVQGQIVWSDPSQQYGVQFLQEQAGLSARILSWAQALVKNG